MASPVFHAPAQSTYSPTNSSSSYRPSSLNPTRDTRSGSLRDTAYNGSEGYINDSTSAYFDDPLQQDVQLAAPCRTTTPPARTAFGARLLSTISNAQPAAAALGRKGSILHSRARSLAAYVPKLNAGTTTASTSPERGERLVQAPNKIFGDLFNGESAPIRLGVAASPTKEKDETEFVMEYTSTLTERPGSMFKRRDTMESSRSTPPQQQARKTSWFTRKPTVVTPTKQQQQDDLANLNINLSLFPNGPADPLSPAAFNDLLLNATNLLQRMQTAYREKTDFIASIQPEIDAQREEVEEAETRSKHLKMQLQDMALQTQEQERTIQDLAHHLTEEKLRVQELRDNAARSVRLVRESGARDEADETPTRRRTTNTNKRRSNESASDSGFESDIESVFSAHTTGTSADTPASSDASYVAAMAGGEAEAWALCQPVGPNALHRQTSASTITSKTSSSPSHHHGGGGASWVTVEQLRGENRALRGEVEELRGSLQGCIDFVRLLEG